MKFLFDALKEVYKNAIVAFSDQVDLIMFMGAAVLSYFDITGTHFKGAIGFFTFYLFFVFVRMAYFKRVIAETKKKANSQPYDKTVIF
ncbi:MAG: hypothetical protein Q8R96_11595 [Bacteroidota bacterium]|nr:hypothetical protein [Bacteroidota bacterium]